MNNQECFETCAHTFINESSSINWIEFVNCIVGVVALLGGLWCFVQIRKLKEKKLDATFSFLTRLSIRLQLLSSSLEKYPKYILNTLYNPKIRSEHEVIDDNSYSEKIVTLFLQNCQETLVFLLNSDNQIPLRRGWVEKYNYLIEFLDVYIKTEDKDFYIWDSKTKLEEEFYESHLSNMKDMLNEIYQEQKKLEKKLTSKKSKNNQK